MHRAVQYFIWFLLFLHEEGHLHGLAYGVVESTEDLRVQSSMLEVEQVSKRLV